MSAPTVELQTQNWIQTEQHKNNVYIQTKKKQNDTTQTKIEKADMYIQSFTVLAWLAGSVVIWMLLKQWVPAFSVAWDILAVIVFVYFSLILVWKLYKLWIY